MKELRKTESDSVVLSTKRGNRHQLKHNEFRLNNCPPPPFSSKVGQTPEQVAQGCYRVCVLENIQNPTGDSPEQSVLLDPVLIRDNWKKRSPKAAFQVELLYDYT